LKLINYFVQIAHGTAQPVQLCDDDRVTGAQVTERSIQRGPSRQYPGDMFDEHFL